MELSPNPFDHDVFVISELVTTEDTFNTNMQTVFDVLISPLNSLAAQNRIVIQNRGILELFDKLHLLLIKNREFLMGLNKYSHDPDNTTLDEIFASFPELIPCFFVYIHSFYQHSSALRQERQSNSSFDQFVSSKEIVLKDSFQSFLIQPIQRPPRYRLLLQELFQDLPRGTPARDFLERIHADLCTSISEVDGQIERYDELIEKTELISRITDFDVFSEARSLFFKGSATKFSRKRTEERFLVVFSDVLIVAEPLPLNRRAFRVNKLYKSGEYNILSVDDHPPFLCAVDVRQQRKSFRLNMATSDEKKAILAAFERVLQACGVSQSQLRMRGFAPVWIPDDLAPKCMNCGSKFSFVNRRHHCRYCGDCICGKCFKSKIVCPGLGPLEQTVCPKCFISIKDGAAHRLRTC
jgi:hypothetical protein